MDLFHMTFLMSGFLFFAVLAGTDVPQTGHILRVLNQTFVPKTLSLTVSLSLQHPQETVCRYKFAFRPTTDSRPFARLVDLDEDEERLSGPRTISFTETGFQLNDNYTVEVRSMSCKRGAVPESDVLAELWFTTPSCLAASKFDLSLCAPPPPRSVTFNFTEVSPCSESNITTIFIKWLPPVIPEDPFHRCDKNWTYQVYWNRFNEDGEKLPDFQPLLDRRNIKLSESNITISNVQCGSFFQMDVFVIGSAGRSEKVSRTLRTPAQFIPPLTSSCNCSEPFTIVLLPHCNCLLSTFTSLTTSPGRSVPAEDVHFLTNFVGIGMGVLCLCLLLLGTTWWIRKKRKTSAQASNLMSVFNAENGKNPIYMQNPEENENAIWIPHGSSKGRIPRVCLELKEVIAWGSFGSVHHGILRAPTSERPLIVAVKTVLASVSDDNRQALLGEISVLSQLAPHRNIVEILGVVACPSEVLLILEYCSNGDLANYLRGLLHTEEKILPDAQFVLDSELRKQFLSFASQIATGMSHLAANNIVHRDLAARNILLTSEFTIKITDFGLSRVTPDYYRQVNNGRVPWKWLAPECLNISRCFSTKSDVWAFGIVLCEIFSLGNQPYPQRDYPRISIPDDLEQFLASGQRMLVPALCGTEVYSITRRCWSALAPDRPDFEDLRKAFKKMLEPAPVYLSVLDEHQQRQSYVQLALRK